MAPDDFKAWKRRRRATNEDLVALTGMSASTVDRKLNGRTPITDRLVLQLENIDRLIRRRELPARCPERLARLIIAGDLR